MDLKQHKSNWDLLAKENSPEWVVDTRKKNWDQAEFFETGRVLIDDILEFLNHNNISFNGVNALDFGCGVGRLTQSLSKYFNHVDGTDISEEMIRQANLKNSKGEACNYFTSDSEKLENVPDEKYDFVFTYATLQHIEPYYVKRYLESFVRVLKKDGLIVFQEHAYAFNKKEHAKNMIKSILPRAIVNYIKKVKNKDEAIMEVFAIPKDTIIGWLDSFGAELVCMREEPNASSSHQTYLYVFRKK